MNSLARLPRSGTLHVDLSPQTMEHVARDLGFAFFTVDEGGRIAYWGAAAESMLGFPAAEMLGTACIRSLGCAECRGHGAMHAAPGESEIRLRCADDTLRPFRRSAFPRHEGGRSCGGLEILVPAADAAVLDQEAPLTRDPRFSAVFDEARRAAAVGLPTYLEGEPGTPKLDAARRLFPRLPIRAEACAGLGAHELARLVEADRPSLLVLEEISDLAPNAQRVLLTALRRRCEAASAGQPAIPVALACIGTSPPSNVAPELAALVTSLRAVIPPLRSRPDDLEPLVWAALARVSRDRRITYVEPAAWEALRKHTWPGNSEELRLVVLRAYLRGRGTILRREDLGDLPGKTARPVATRKQQDAVAERVRRALDDAGGRVALAADALGISRSTLWRIRRQHGL